MTVADSRRRSRPAVYQLGGEGPPLILAHAAGLHGRVWASFVEYLGERFECWSLDFRGHGDTDLAPDDDLAWAGFGEDVVAAVEHAGLDKPYAFGHSMGGAALLQAASVFGVEFAGMYLYEPGVLAVDRPPELSDAYVTAAARRRPWFSSADEALGVYRTKQPTSLWAPDVLAAYVTHGLRAADGGVALKCLPSTEARTYAGCITEPTVAEWGPLAFPAVIARGSRSAIFSEAQGRRLAGNLGCTELIQVPGLHHWGPLESPRRVADSVFSALRPRPRR